MAMERIEDVAPAIKKKVELTDNFKDAVNDVLGIEDLLNGLESLETESWPEWTRASKKEFLARVRAFPEGVHYYRIDNDFGGLSTSMVIYVDDPDNIRSWEEVTDYGMITSHNPKGNALYVVSVWTSPRYRGRGIGQTLVSRQIDLAKKLWLGTIVLGSRLPRLSKYNWTAEEYIQEKTEDWFSIDPLVRFYQECGLEIGKLKPNYMLDDRESRNYGVIMKKNLKND